MEATSSPLLSSKDTLILIRNRCLLPSKTFVSTKGFITSMSAVFRMKNDKFFLVELDHEVYILFKDFHLNWHQNLNPKTNIILSDLRLTTIEKGVAEPQSILIAWKTSQINMEPNLECICHEEFMEWMSSVALSSSIPLETPHSITPYCTEFSMKLLDVQGRVTDATGSEDNLFILDNKFQLYTGFIPSVNCGDEIREGCRLRIYNAHCLPGNLEDTYIACARTLIRCDSHSHVNNQISWRQSDSSNCEKKSSNPSFRSLIIKYCLNFSEIKTLLTMKHHLSQNEKNIPNILKKILKSDICKNIQPLALTPIDLFIHHDHFCQLIDKHLSRDRLPSVQSVRHLLTMSLENEENVPSDRQELPKGQWSFVHRTFRESEVLIGVFGVDKFGQLELMDQSGKIKVVLLHDLSMQGPGRESAESGTYSRKRLQFHRCNLKCIQTLKSTETCVCSYMSEYLIKKLVVIRKYHLLNEHYRSPSTNEAMDYDKLVSHNSTRDVDSELSNEIKSYLLISLKDCILLENMSKRYNQNVFDNETLPCDHQDKFSKFINRTNQFSSCLVYVSAKDFLISSNTTKVQFSISGQLISQREASDMFLTENSYFNGIHSKDALLCRKLEQKHVNIKKKPAYTEMADLLESTDEVKKMKGHHFCQNQEKIVDIVGDASYESSQNPHDNQNLHQQDTSSCYNEIRKIGKFHTQPVTLLFSRAALITYPFFAVNNFYLLSLPVSNGLERNAFRPTFLNAKAGETILKSNSNVFIDVREKVSVEKAVVKDPLLCEEVMANFMTNELLTLKEVVAVRDSVTCVSFRGVVCERINIMNSHSLKELSATDDVRLTIRDVSESTVFIHLYIKSFLISNILGLVPGCVVDFYSIEKRLSQKGNLYCKFGVASSLQLCTFLSYESNLYQRCRTGDIDSFPREYLYNIWHLDVNNLYGSQLVWQIQCHICRVFQISLKLVCSLCQGLYMDNKCQCRNCRGSSSFQIKVYAVVLIDDGTSQATVKFYTSDLIQKLLTLNNEQWRDMLTVIQESGEIFINKYERPAYDSSSLENFVIQLIQSPIVRRSCIVVVRRMKNSPSKASVDEMSPQGK